MFLKGQYGLFVKTSDADLKVYAGIYLNEEHSKIYLLSTKEIFTLTEIEMAFDRGPCVDVFTAVSKFRKGLSICMFDERFFTTSGHYMYNVLYGDKSIGYFKSMKSNNVNEKESCTYELLLDNEKRINQVIRAKKLGVSSKKVFSYLDDGQEGSER